MRAAVVLILGALAAARPAAAADAISAPSGEATRALQSRDAEIRAALPPPGGEVTPEVRKRIEAIVTKAVDLRGMAESALGPRWKQMTESQRKRLVAAFENRFRKLSGGELDQYRSVEVKYDPEQPGPDGAVNVPTHVVVKGEPTEIAYTLRKQKDAWRIVDIAIDGASTVENYRAAFARVINKDGVEGLIKKLESGAAGSKPAAGAAGKAAPG
ncbi:MAG TPA: ABC transporter substrate-binding protein [Anaeromyxobacteraceae bacterium]|nr:ABC transporter substrate-binding protein [Anaeromyxobacteraceae bacterium]